MKYLIVIAMVIRGELESLSLPLDKFTIIDSSGPDHTPGNSHSILCYKKEELSSDQEAIEYVQTLSKWRRSLIFDSYLRDGYIKSGHMLLHSISDNCAVWSEYEDRISYLFDSKESDNYIYVTEYDIDLS